MSYQDNIIKFNADKRVIQLREKYNEPTFFEIISKERSETTYSSFLKWMFEKSMPLSNDANPLLLLLDVLVEKADNDKKEETIDKDLKTSIISRNLKIIEITAELEKSVKDLACDCKLKNKAIEENKTLFIQKCSDRLDLFIRCNIELVDKEIKELQIIIENKIDSKQQAEKKNKIGIDDYDNANQTTRYFNATKRKGKKLYQIYVYLTPVTPEENLDRHESFIHITYQDLYERVVEPLLVVSSLSRRSRFFLEEFSNQLIYPSLNDDTINQGLAIAQDQSNMFTDLWNNYKELIIVSILSLYNKDIKDLDGNITKWWKNKNKASCDSYNDEVKDLFGLFSNFFSNIDEERDLLDFFFNHNKKIIMALLTGFNPDKEDKIIKDFLLNELSKRDTTKYTLEYSNNPIATNLSKKRVMIEVFKKLLELEKLPSPNTMIGNVRFYYENEDTFEKAYKDGQITDARYNYRYTKIEGGYRVYNLYGSHNWNDAQKILNGYGFTLKPE